MSEFFSLVSENDLHIIQRSLDFPSLSYEQLRYLDHIDLSKEQMDKVFVVDITDKSLQLFFTQVCMIKSILHYEQHKLKNGSVSRK